MKTETINGKVYEVVSCSNLSCAGCAFYTAQLYCSKPDEGSCTRTFREDNLNVIFVEIQPTGE